MTATSSAAPTTRSPAPPAPGPQPVPTQPAPAPAGPVAWRLLAAAAAAGPPLFVAVATLAGLLTPGYDARTRNVSELVLGPLGWLQTVNFYALALAMIAFALVLWRGLRPAAPVATALATLLLVVAGAGSVVCGLYPTDLKGAPETAVGQVHNLASLVVYLAVIAACGCTAAALRTAPGWRGYAWYTTLTAPAIFGLLVVFIGFGSDPGDPLYPVAGLLQRGLILVALGWITVIARRLLALPRGLVR